MDRDNLPPRPRVLNRPDWRAGLNDKKAVRQSPPPRAIRPISCDCSARVRPARPRPLPGRPSRGSNLFSSSDIREDMRQPVKRLKYLSNERQQSAVCCAAKAAQSLRRTRAETDSLPEKRCADKDIAAFLRRAEIRFILRSALQPASHPKPRPPKRFKPTRNTRDFHLRRHSQLGDEGPMVLSPIVAGLVNFEVRFRRPFVGVAALSRELADVWTGKGEIKICRSER
jgi:hypothetical protein